MFDRVSAYATNGVTVSVRKRANEWIFLFFFYKNKVSLEIR